MEHLYAYYLTNAHIILSICCLNTNEYITHGINVEATHIVSRYQYDSNFSFNCVALEIFNLYAAHTHTHIKWEMEGIVR